VSAGWLAAAVALAVAVCTGIAWLTRWLWRLAKRTVHFLDDWNGQPAHDGMEARPGVMARLHSVEELAAKILHETTPNGGGNLRDAVRLIAQDVTAIKDEQGKVRQQLESRARTRREGQRSV
jgi:hypothetical protein